MANLIRMEKIGYEENAAEEFWADVHETEVHEAEIQDMTDQLVDEDNDIAARIKADLAKLKGKTPWAI